MAGPWEKYQTAARPAAGPIIGPAKPVDPYKEEDQQFQRNAEARAAEDQQFQREKFEFEKNKFEAEKTNSSAGMTASISQLRTALSNLEAVGQEAEKTGAVGTWTLDSLRELYPGAAQARANIEGSLQQIKGLNLIEAMQRIKQSGAGSATQLMNSNVEGQIYASLNASLDPGQDYENFTRNLQAQKDSIKTALAIAEGQDPSDPVVRKKYGISENGQSQQSAITIDPAVLAQQGPDQGDPNTPNPGVLYGDPRGANLQQLQRPQIETPTQYAPSEAFATDLDKQYASRLNAMFKGGASAEQLIAFANRFAAKHGGKYTPADEAFIGKTRAAVQYREKNGPYDAFAAPETGEKSGIVNALGSASQTTGGALLTGIGNGATLGGIDELAGMVGGDQYSAQVQGAKEAAVQNNGAAYLAGNVGGNVLALATLPTSLAERAATVPGMVGVGALSGALENNDNRTGGAALGGALGWAVPKALDKFVVPAAQKAANTLAPVAEKISSVLPKSNALAPEILEDAAQAKIPMMRSDMNPPKTAIGKAARKLGEMVPIAGTGGQRAAQQEARTNAVKELADEYGISSASIDDVAKDLTETRGAMIAQFKAQKDQIIENIQTPAQAPRAIAMLDQKIAEAGKVNTPASRALVTKLQDFKKALQGESREVSTGVIDPNTGTAITRRVDARQNTLKELEAIRREMGEAFSDPSLANIKREGEKALRAVYGPLRDDMAATIRKSGGDEVAKTWRIANARLASMAEELQSTALKSTLNKAASTPEDVARLLFSAKPSQVRLLYNNLSPAGRAKAQGAIIAKAMEKAGDDVSPDKFANSISDLSKSVGVFFQGADLARVNGLERVLQATKRAAQAGVLPENGSQILPYAIPASVTQLFGGSGAAAAVGVAGYGLLARVYESPAVYKALLKLGRTKPGSLQESKLMPSVIATMSAANDNLTRIMGQSPGKLAAAEDENN